MTNLQWGRVGRPHGPQAMRAQVSDNSLPCLLAHWPASLGKEGP
ncbi:hypothetical protein [Pandoraea cepalis]|nr:hypothetical protein [Pandoraea cepalis]